jgi:hypothetical protein
MKSRGRMLQGKLAEITVDFVACRYFCDEAIDSCLGDRGLPVRRALMIFFARLPRLPKGDG